MQKDGIITVFADEERRTVYEVTVIGKQLMETEINRLKELYQNAEIEIRRGHSMRTKVIRPFWSYDVQRTEAWLLSMAEQGYDLVKINRVIRCFYFQQGKPRKRTYRIEFDKNKFHSLPKGLVEDGWTKVLQSGKWHVLANEKPLDQLKAFPVREGIIKHNKLIKYISTGIFIYLTAPTLLYIILGLVMYLNNILGEIVESPYWIITYFSIGIGIVLWVLALYSIITIHKTNKNLIEESIDQTVLEGKNTTERALNKDEEKLLKPSDQLITKRNFGWMYAPDKLKKWLEAMEERGFNLYHIGRTGTVFYFIVGSPRKISYCADYQNIADEIR